MKLLLILFSGFLMNACGPHQEATTNDMENKITAQTSKEELSGVYIVQLLAEELLEYKKLTLNFNTETKTVSGFSGCNNFSCSYKENVGNISFVDIISTEMYCEDGSKTEAIFMKSLSNTKTFQLKNGALVLQTENGVVLTAQSLKKEAIIQEPKNIVTYVASTRGYFFEAVLFENKFLVTEQRGQKKPRIVEVSNEDMEIIKALITNINVKTISTIESPTKKRHFDGAAHANITITQDNELYRGAGFDHGFPPIELKVLVNKILLLTKTEKQ